MTTPDPAQLVARLTELLATRNTDGAAVKSHDWPSELRRDITEHGVCVAARDALPDLLATITSLTAERDAMRAALGNLESYATAVNRYGASPGPQWVQLSAALVCARAALQPTKGENT